jgi:hypothetical protein
VIAFLRLDQGMWGGVLCVIPGGGPRPVRRTSHVLCGQGPLGSRRKNEADVCVHNRTERTQVRTYNWNCSLLYNFNITIF